MFKTTVKHCSEVAYFWDISCVVLLAMNTLSRGIRTVWCCGEWIRSAEGYELCDIADSEYAQQRDTNCVMLLTVSTLSRGIWNVWCCGEWIRSAEGYELCDVAESEYAQQRDTNCVMLRTVNSLNRAARSVSGWLEVCFMLLSISVILWTSLLANFSFVEWYAWIICSLIFLV